VLFQKNNLVIWKNHSYNLGTLPSGILIWPRHTISKQENYEIRVNLGHLGRAAYNFPD